MRKRDTSTGAVLEAMVLPALTRGGYQHKTHVHIGQRPGQGKHIVDIVATDQSGNSSLISVKWQQTSGTAEQKVPFEVMCLAEAVLAKSEGCQKAFLVLGGPGWKLRDYFLSGSLEKHLQYASLVKICTLESFVAMANAGEL